LAASIPKPFVKLLHGKKDLTAKMKTCFRSKKRIGCLSEVCRIRSTGVNSGRSWRFSTGSGAGSGVDIFD